MEVYNFIKHNKYFFTYVLAIVIILFGFFACQKQERVKQSTIDSLGVTYVKDGEPVKWCVFVDPDTGENYLYNDLGGVVHRSGISW